MSVAILKYRRYYIDRIISQTLAHDERCLGPRSEREAPTASLQAILVPAAHG
jgi:hypothetical protein